MSDLTVAELVSGLQRTTLALAATALVVWCLLRLTRSSSPALHRAAWIAVLLQGWMLIRWVVNVPWYDPPSRVPRPPAFDFSEAASMSPRDVPPPPPVLRPAARERWNWQVFVLAGWMTGMVAAVGYWITVYVRFVRGLPLGDPADAVAEAAWQRLLVERNVRCLIPLRLANGLGPVLCRLPAGYRLLLPRTEWQNLCIDARMTILRHELAHYEHADVWKSLAARLLALPHWFNPFAWWTVRNFDEGAEWACDDAVRTAAPEKASALGRALLQLG
ncbi:MAG TPA: M56 family metallopeptidase, partial [Pirellulales bacterium]|nr:M56 family metallopeptidase [Pirellulales bacterium]